MRAVRARKRRKIIGPCPRRRRPLTDDEEIDAEVLAIGPGDKPSGEGG
jgi:hypothetical protein